MSGCDLICVENDLGVWLAAQSPLLTMGDNFYVGLMQPWTKRVAFKSHFLREISADRSVPMLAGGRCDKREHTGRLQLTTIGDKGKAFEAKQCHRELMCLLDFPTCPPLPFCWVRAIDGQPFRLSDADGAPVFTTTHEYMWRNI